MANFGPLKTKAKVAGKSFFFLVKTKNWDKVKMSSKIKSKIPFISALKLAFYARTKTAISIWDEHFRAPKDLNNAHF